nr:50S ribosomal protein L3 [Planctomycetales bacterium]
MAIGLLGRKVGMTQLYDAESSEVIPVTVIQAGPCHVLQLRTQDRDGYEAVQLGYLDKPRRLAARSQRGHVAKLDSKRARQRAAAGIETLPKPGCEPKRLIREFRGSTAGVNVGDEIGVDSFAEIKAVDVVGTSKGRGFAGAMKRHNFAGQRASHGVKKCHRHLGGTGCSAYPSRLFKGRKMPGRYGGARSTTRNLRLVAVDPAEHLLVIRGAVPGPNGGYVMIRETNQFSRRPRPGADSPPRGETHGRTTMVSLPIYDKTGKKVGSYEMDPAELAPRINRQLLHDAVVMYQANQRQGSIRTKSRSDVSGSTKKMYRQKG